MRRSTPLDHRSTKPSSAFTLIELLVVVAIIAILAAIALPNFLEAQTRAKVSRARADIRTVTTAVEAYAVDWNQYPTYHYSAAPIAALEFHIGGAVPDFGIPDPNWDGRNPLTTPVAYITSMPGDPFAQQRGGEPAEIREFLYTNWIYAVNSVSDAGRKQLFQYAFNRYGTYRIHSRGPDTDGPDSGTPYDATNGSLSDGDITYGPNTGFDTYIPFPMGP